MGVEGHKLQQREERGRERGQRQKERGGNQKRKWRKEKKGEAGRKTSQETVGASSRKGLYRVIPLRRLSGAEVQECFLQKATL